MIDNTRVYEILTEICESVTIKNTGNGFRCRCPVCGDSKKSNRIQRLHVDYYNKYNDYIAKCWNGGCPLTGSTNIISLYAMVKGISYKESKKIIDNEIYDTDKIKKRLSKKKKTTTVDQIENKDIVLPDHIISIDDKPKDRFQKRYQDELKKFLSTRMIPKDKICYVAYDGDYKGRVIIPIYKNKKLKYFQGRSLFDIIQPKYKNPKIDKTGTIINSDKFNKDLSLIVTEGILDCWTVENNQGTACLGSYFNDDLIAKLYQYTNKDVILCFDNIFIDKAGMNELKKFIHESKYKNKVKYLLPDSNKYKDLNELHTTHKDINIYDYCVLNSYNLYKLKTKLKLLYKYNI